MKKPEYISKTIIVLSFVLSLPCYSLSFVERHSAYKRDKEMISLIKSDRELTNKERVSILSWIRGLNH